VLSTPAAFAAIAGNTSNTLDTAYPFYFPFTTPVRVVDYAAELSGGVIASSVSALLVRLRFRTPMVRP
jgi:hypothetical protein